MSEPPIQIEHLKKYFPIERGVLRKTVGYVKAVDDVSLAVPAAQILGLVGESGCGKTTLGRMTIGLIKPTSGSVRFDGKDIFTLAGEEMRKFRRRAQIIFQDPESSLNPRLTVRSTVAEAMRASGQEASDDAILFLLEKVGLAREHTDRYPHELSGGQKQRVGIARALAVNPDFIVADEPVSALDVSIRAQIVNLLVGLQRELKLSLLYISHDLSTVRYAADQVAVMYLGKIMEVAPTAELFQSPKHPYTQALISAIPKAEPEPPPREIVLKGDVPSPANPPTGCRFHTRCPYAFDKCVTKEPALIKAGTDAYAACHLLG